MDVCNLPVVCSYDIMYILLYLQFIVFLTFLLYSIWDIQYLNKDTILKAFSICHIKQQKSIHTYNKSITQQNNNHTLIMPVPKRRNRKSKGFSFQLSDLPSMAKKMFDINYVFQKSRMVLFYSFAPAIFYLGMTTEPRPQSWFEPFNILE